MFTRPMMRILITLVMAISLSNAGCRKSNENDVDAVHIERLWKWFGKYSDNITDILKIFSKNKDEMKSADTVLKLIPDVSLQQIKSIVSKNQNQFAKKLSLLKQVKNGSLVLHDFPLKRLPKNIPAKYEKAFEVLKNSMQDKGKEKLSVRRLMSQMVSKHSKANGISPAKSWEMQLEAFILSKFGTEAKPLPNEFAGVNTFYGHMITTKAPFKDVAFGPNGVLGPEKAPMKASHGVFVHIEDFFEWDLLCKLHDCGSAKLPDLMYYIAGMGIAENAMVLKKKIQTAKSAGDFKSLDSLTKEFNESLSLLGLKSSKPIDDFEKGITITFNTSSGPIELVKLDWSKTNFTPATALWDVFFDFQNLSDDAFKQKDSLRRAFGNPEEGFLAFSMHVASNPMFMGRKEVVNVLFPGIGWH